MILTQEEQRKYIEKHFMKSYIIDHTINQNQDDINSYTADPFLPNKPSMYDVDKNQGDNDNTQSTSFKYLDDNILSSDIASFPRDLTESYNIHLCMFSINQELDTPFLQFMFSKNESSYTFPSKELNMEPFDEVNSEDNILPQIEYNDSDEDNDDTSIITNYDDSIIDNEFMKQCKVFFDETTNQHEDNVDIHKIYRGFLDAENNKDLYVFFDCTGLHIDINHDKFASFDYIFAIVDEINNQKILGVNIHEDIVSLFEKNYFVKELNSMIGEPIHIPKIVYLCNQNTDETMSNEFYEDGNNMSIINTQISHDTYGDIYVFSSDSLNDNYDKIKRVAIFYEEIEDEEETHVEIDEPIEENSEHESSSSDDEENSEHESSSSDDEENSEHESSSSDDEENSEHESSSSDDEENSDNESSSSDDEENSDNESSSSDDEENSDNESSSSEDDTIQNKTNVEEEKELVENAVFRFTEGNITLYGTDSEERFIVL
jgi:hypothetical protein